MVFKEAKEITKKEALQLASRQSFGSPINFEKGELADGES